ncbi:Uncharacterized protein ChrSV_0152 [Chromobacterium vaccinii]|nr:Uncharacterized protein ChrSW_0152 [Chromobacterium vaccinii]QND87611.1 Uncharacterized protein ChrSV_0152 [Chromobacterium vaccinii]
MRHDACFEGRKSTVYQTLPISPIGIKLSSLKINGISADRHAAGRLQSFTKSPPPQGLESKGRIRAGRGPPRRGDGCLGAALVT